MDLILPRDYHCDSDPFTDAGGCVAATGYVFRQKHISGAEQALFPFFGGELHLPGQ